MVGCNFDGASVMLGSKSGVAQKLTERVGDYLVPIHCVAHCRELAILDAVKEVPYLKTFQETVQEVKYSNNIIIITLQRNEESLSVRYFR